MLRVTLRSLQSAPAGGKKMTRYQVAVQMGFGMSKGPGTPTAIGSGTSVVNNRIVTIRKKGKWIDRRSKKIPHNGKDVFAMGEQPSCALCHVRFKFKQDYQAHKESELHKARVKWVEMQEWWENDGKPQYTAAQRRDWEWYVEKVAKPRAAHLQVPVDSILREARKARMVETPKAHRMLQPPIARPEIREPRDQRWPATPKW
jgi:hypothetical protein